MLLSLSPDRRIVFNPRFTPVAPASNTSRCTTNNQRLHSALGYESPRQYESRYQPEKGTTFSKGKITATLCAEGAAKARRANEINGGKRRYVGLRP
jgi:hypothetical protein